VRGKRAKQRKLRNFCAGKTRKTAQNAKFLRCAKTRKTAQNAKFSRCAKARKTAQNARNFGFAAQNSAKSAEFGRAKTAQKQSAKMHNAHPWLRVTLAGNYSTEIWHIYLM